MNRGGWCMGVGAVLIVVSLVGAAVVCWEAWAVFAAVDRLALGGPFKPHGTEIDPSVAFDSLRFHAALAAATFVAGALVFVSGIVLLNVAPPPPAPDAHMEESRRLRDENRRLQSENLRLRTEQARAWNEQQARSGEELGAGPTG